MTSVSPPGFIRLPPHEQSDMGLLFTASAEVPPSQWREISPTASVEPTLDDVL